MHQIYTCYTNPTQKSIKDLNLSKLSVDLMVDPCSSIVSRHMALRDRVRVNRPNHLH